MFNKMEIKTMINIDDKVQFSIKQGRTLFVSTGVVTDVHDFMDYPRDAKPIEEVKLYTIKCDDNKQDYAIFEKNVQLATDLGNKVVNCD